MNLPESINICGIPYKLVQNPKTMGGSFNEGTLTIKIGTRFKEDIPDTLLHEVIESVFAKRRMRATKENDPDNGDYIFCFDHEQFQLAIADIAAALRGIQF